MKRDDIIKTLREIRRLSVIDNCKYFIWVKDGKIKYTFDQTFSGKNFILAIVRSNYMTTDNYLLDIDTLVTKIERKL